MREKYNKRVLVIYIHAHAKPKNTHTIIWKNARGKTRGVLLVHKKLQARNMHQVHLNKCIKTISTNASLLVYRNCRTNQSI
jgi:hypothetical protein